MPPQLRASVIILVALLGCVNRGRHAPSDGGGAGGAGGADAGPKDTQGDMGGGGAAACDPDGGAMDAGSCTALFNFEAPSGCGLYGATLTKAPTPDTAPNFDAFTRVYHTDIGSCGKGALAVDIVLDRTARYGGEVIIPISPAIGSTFNGKTLTLSIKGSVAGGPNTKFFLYLITTRYEEVARNILIPATFTTLSIPLPVPDASSDPVIGIALQVHNSSVDLYTGTLYVDEIDLKPTLPDGGTPDGSVPDAGTMDTRPGDVGDGGIADVRDAPAGS